MSPNDNAGRIHRVPLMVTSITLFILALLAVLARILIRLRSKNPISTDDALLYFGVICLSAAMALLVDLSKPLYLDEALSTSFPETELPPNYIKLLMRFHKVADVYLALTCTAIFSVKFSFLFFFRILVQRVQKMNVYWWTVTGVMVVAWVVTMIVAIFLPCPYFDLRSLSCAQGSELPKTIGLAALGNILDIATDILILIIPIHLIWHTKVNPRQKLILSATLCLSIVMIVIAVIRISNFRIASTQTDLVWEIFWLHVEACVAVIMISVSAFRSFFVAHESRLRENQNRNRLWYMSKQNLRRSVHRWKKSSDERNQLPEIPRATMTGMRTLIRGKGNGTESWVFSQNTLDATTPVSEQDSQRIGAEYTTSTASDELPQPSQTRDPRNFE